ncbi:hypothetical protein HMI54_009197, partial [Coelomomyces lativittatus]
VFIFKVHVQIVSKEDYPLDLIVFHGIDTLEGVFLHSLKESDYMKYGSAQKMMTLSKPDTQQLWQGVVQSILFLFSNIYTCLHFILLDATRFIYFEFICLIRLSPLA